MEDPEPSLLILAISLCLLVLAFTSAVDAAFTAISRHRLHALLDENGPRTRRAVARLIDDPYRFRTTVLVLNTSVTIMASALTLALVSDGGPLATAGGLAALFLAMLTFSEVVPKAIATRNPDAAALLLAAPMSTLSLVLWPLIALISVPLRPIYRLFSGQDAPSTPMVTEEELRLMVNVGEEEGLIEHEERAMIEGVIAFGDTLLREIMVPRVDMVALELGSTLDRAMDVVASSGHSRIPVYNESLDHVVGVLYAKDLIPALREHSRYPIIDGLLRPAYFVPDTMKVNLLLEDLQRRKVHMAVIVDEYGGTAGLVTIEDLIEQIVGEIQDEYDTEDPSIQPLSAGEYIVDARVLLHDINGLLDLGLTAEAERLGGMIYEQLGRVPRVGDEVELDEAKLTVLSVKGVRAQKLRIVRRHQEAASGPQAGELAPGDIRGPV